MHLLSILTAIVSAGATQVPFIAENPSNSYEFKWPIQNIAIIGAGPGGLIAYREFTRPEFNFSVRVFERDSVPGGTWHYTDETPTDAPIPNADPEVGDYVPSLPPLHQDLPYEETYHDDSSMFSWRWKDHRAPKPVWKSLEANAPSGTQQVGIRGFPWPEDTPWVLPQATIHRYVRAFASWRGINSDDNHPDISYNTRVESVTERYTRATDGSLIRCGWTLTLKKLVKTGDYHTSKAIWWTEDFDAVVVATGRFNAPSIPNIDGLSQWKARFPQSVSHSRDYRRPDRFTNKTVLVVGAATSGSEITRDIISSAGKVYLSTRHTNMTSEDALLHGRIPRNVTTIGEIQRFHPLTTAARDVSSGEILLRNGTTITGVDHIIFATGFHYSFPFLKQYHDRSLGLDDRAPKGKPQPLVTDGTHMRSLYLDVFYIEEPTIGFMSMNTGIQAFLYSEYIALSLAKVWAGRAKLPTTNELWRVHNQVVGERGGYGKKFMFLGLAKTKAFARFFTAWLNDAAVQYGGRQIDPPPNVELILGLWIRWRFGVDLSKDSAINAVESREERVARIYDLAFADDW